MYTSTENRPTSRSPRNTALPPHRRVTVNPARMAMRITGTKADDTDSGSNENRRGGTDSSGHGRKADLTDSGTDDNHNGATDSGERGHRAHR